MNGFDMKKLLLVMLLGGGVFPLTQSGCHAQTSSSFGELSDAGALIDGATARELRDVGLDLAAEKQTLDQNQVDLEKAWDVIEEGPGRDAQRYNELRNRWRDRARYHTASIQTWAYANAIQIARNSPNETNTLAVEDARKSLAATLGAMNSSERGFGWGVIATRVSGGQFSIQTGSQNEPSVNLAEAPVVTVQLKGDEKVVIPVTITSANLGAQIKFITNEAREMEFSIKARDPMQQGYSLRACNGDEKSVNDCQLEQSLSVKNGSRVQVAGPVGVAQVEFGTIQTGKNRIMLQLVDQPAADAFFMAKDLSRFGLTPACDVDNGFSIESARNTFTQVPREFFFYAAKDFDVAPDQRGSKTSTIRKDEALLLTDGQILRVNGECFRPIVSNAEIEFAAKEAPIQGMDLTLLAAKDRFTNERPAKVVSPGIRPIKNLNADETKPEKLRASEALYQIETRFRNLP